MHDRARMATSHVTLQQHVARRSISGSAASRVRASFDRVPRMRRQIPAVRIWPMSDKLEGFVARSIEDVQVSVFLDGLPACGGRYRYPKVGLNAEPGTVVLFQYR